MNVPPIPSSFPHGTTAPMKAILQYALLILIAAILGALVGGGISWYEYGHTAEHFFENQWPPVDPKKVAPIARLIGLPDFAFEQPLVAGKTYRREFLFQNDGTSELEIDVVRHSDNIQIDLEGTLSIRPGVSMPIELKFTPAEGQDTFAGWVELKTNDPERQAWRLTVRGSVQPSAQNNGAGDPGK